MVIFVAILCMFVHFNLTQARALADRKILGKKTKGNARECIRVYQFSSWKFSSQFAVRGHKSHRSEIWTNFKSVSQKVVSKNRDIWDIMRYISCYKSLKWHVVLKEFIFYSCTWSGMKSNKPYTSLKDPPISKRCCWAGWPMGPKKKDLLGLLGLQGKFKI